MGTLEALRLEHIVKRFPGVIALKNVDFSLEFGEVHAICGENGAGKSTLMKVVCGVYAPDEGKIYLDGSEVNFTNPNEAYEKGVAIIFQETSLFEEMTVLENMFLGHEIQKHIGWFKVIDYAEMQKKAIDIFEKLNTKIDLNEKIKSLGMAQKQMVEIAKALTYDAKVLILDEPSASLTQREVDALFRVIENLKREGLALVYISHRLEEIFEICDRVTVIRDGEYISTKNVSATTKDELVADMVGRKMDNYYPKITPVIGEKMLEVEHLYDDGFLNDVSFFARKGEILGFAGLAGAGRTELMLSICGFSRKAAGRVTLNGKELNIVNYREAKQQGIAYVSEDRGKLGLVTRMSVKNNISMPQMENISVYGFLSEHKEDELSNKYIKELGIKAPNGDFIVDNLSGGNQQKVSVSKALALQPEVLILDEPTRGVDVNSKAEIYKIISDLTRKGFTILMVSSELPELIGMCDRIYVMREGAIAGYFDKEEVTQEKILKIALNVN
jgi:ABC transporter related